MILTTKSKATKIKTTNSLKESRKSLEKLLEDLPRVRNNQELLNDLLVISPPSRTSRSFKSPERVVSKKDARDQSDQIREEPQTEIVGFYPHS